MIPPSCAVLSILLLVFLPVTPRHLMLETKDGQTQAPEDHTVSNGQDYDLVGDGNIGNIVDGEDLVGNGHTGLNIGKREVHTDPNGNILIRGGKVVGTGNTGNVVDGGDPVGNGQFGHNIRRRDLVGDGNIGNIVDGEDLVGNGHTGLNIGKQEVHTDPNG